MRKIYKYIFALSIMLFWAFVPQVYAQEYSPSSFTINGAGDDMEISIPYHSSSSTPPSASIYSVTKVSGNDITVYANALRCEETSGSSYYRHDFILFLGFGANSSSSQKTGVYSVSTSLGTFRFTITQTPGAIIVPGSISPSSQSITSGSSASTLSHSGYSNVNSRQWQYSTNGSTWYNVSGATGTSYSPGVLTQTRYYRIQLNGTSTYTPTATINVTSPPVAGSISPSSQSINSGGSASALSHTGYSNVTSRQWQHSSNGSTWANISGATGTSYSPGTVSQTTYYRVQVNGTTAYSSAATVTVVNGYVSAETQTITSGSSAASLGHYGYYSVSSRQWQKSTNGSTWTNISGATSQMYSPGYLTQTTYFRVRVNGSETYSSNAVVIVVSPGSVSAASQTIASGSSAATLSHISSSGVTSRQWQYSTNGGTWYNITGATGANYSPGALTQTRYYRVQVNGVSIYSGTATVNVVIPGFATTSSQAISSGSSARTLSHTGSSGVTSRQWQKSTNGSTWTNISGATGTSYSPGVLTQGAYYRVQVNGSNIYSGTAVVAISGNLSPASQTINVGNNAQVITHINSSAVTTRTWEKSTNGSTWTSINNSNTATYSPGALTETTHFRIHINGCGDYSPVATVTVNSFVAGSVSPASQSITSGNAAPTLTHTGSSDVASRQWQSSTNGSRWYDIPGKTAITYSPGALTQTTYYRVLVTGTKGQSVGSVSSKITVNQPLSIGQITPGDQTMVKGETGPVLSISASGGNGSYSYSWEKQSASTSGWVSMNKFTATLNTGNLTETTYFRVIVTSNGESKTSIVRMITVLPSYPRDLEFSSYSVTSGEVPYYGGAYRLIFTVYEDYDASFIAHAVAYLLEQDYGFPFSVSANKTGSYSGELTVSLPRNLSTSPKIYEIDLNSGRLPIPQAMAPNGRLILPVYGGGNITGGGTAPIYMNASQTSNVQYQLIRNGNESSPVQTKVGAGSESRFDFTPVSEPGMYKVKAVYNGGFDWMNGEVQVSTNLTASITTSGSSTITAGENGPTLTIQPNGGVGTYTYQWMRRTDGTNWLSAGTGNSLSTGILNQTTYYKAIVTSGSQTYETSIFTVTVNAFLSLSISGNQNIASGQTPQMLRVSASGGTGSYTYQWHIHNGTGWNSISSATQSTYSPGTLTTTTRYKVAVTSGSQSKEAECTVTVGQELVLSGLAGQTIDHNTRPTALAVTAQGGYNNSYTYQWYQSTNGTNWTVISGATLSSYTPNALTENTHFKVIVKSGTMEKEAQCLITVGEQEAGVDVALSSSENYIVKYIARKAGVITTGTVNTRDAIPSVTYFDGLGRAKQQVEVGASDHSGVLRDIVTPIVYDAMGRADAIGYLPFEASTGTNGTFRSGSVTSQRGFYADRFDDTEADRAFVQKTYEASPLNRVTAQRNVGSAYVNEPVTFAYGTNTANDGVQNIVMDGEGFDATRYYAAGTLYKNSSRNEDGLESHTFTDLLGHTILERTTDGTTTMDTYYVYDDLNRLRWVISPEGSKALTDTTTPAYFCYMYNYDERGNITTKRLPGDGVLAVYMVYDSADRLVASQDGNQRVAGKWTLYRYDPLGRLTQQKEVTENISQDDMKNDYADYYDSSSAVLLAEYMYDVPPPVSGLGFNRFSGINAVKSDSVKGYKTYEKVAVLGGTGTAVERAFYYDAKGRLIQTVERNHRGGRSEYTTEYDFIGNVVATHESNQISSGFFPVTKLTENTYDHRNRLVMEVTTVNKKLPQAATATVTYAYDELGQLASKTFGTGTYAVTETMDYNIQGWLTAQNSDLFQMQLKYYDPRNGIEPSHTGNITEWRWKHFDQTVNSYGFTYDKFARLTGYDHQTASTIGATSWSTQREAFWEQSMSYDLNGNILTLKRMGNQVSSKYYSPRTDELKYFYRGNQLGDASHSNQTGSVSRAGRYGYFYDANGNMTYDMRGSLNYEYNSLNLITTTAKATYQWLSDGTKLQVENSDGNGYIFLGSLVYNKTGSTYRLASTGFSGGRMIAAGSVVTPSYQITDHLGSVRVMFADKNRVLAQNDYYAFGKSHANPLLRKTSDMSNRYLFNGKERQTTGSVGFLDYGARMLDDEWVRWWSMDNKAEKYSSISPYAYCLNNPILFVDPDGNDIVIHFKTNSGQNMTYTFTGQRVNVANKFANQVITAYHYNVGNGGGDAMQAAATDPSVRISVKETDERSRMNPNGIVYWNPSLGTETVYGDVLSPATALEHELDHAYDKKTDPVGHSQRKQTRDSQYQDAEERRVITGNESKTARANGEIGNRTISRDRHTSVREATKFGVVVSGGPTSTQVDYQKTRERYEKKEYERVTGRRSN